MAREAAWRRTGPRLWFLLHGPNRRRCALNAGTGVGLAVAAIFVIATVSGHGTEAAPAILMSPPVLAAAAFFILSLSLLAALTQIVFPAAVRDLEDLRSEIDVDPAMLDDLAASLDRLPLRSSLPAVPVAMTLSAAHIWLLGETTPYEGPWLAGSICNVLLWVAMFQIAMPLVHNARLFSLLGRCARVDLYNPDRLAPFGRTAIRPCLFIIALQCAYAILMIPESTSLMRGGVPLGLVASMGLVAGLFFLPLRGIRERIRGERARTLLSLDDRLGELTTNSHPGAPDTPIAKLAEADRLLALRSRVASVSTWPLGFAGVRQLFIYVVLVPLTWVGAALVEMMIDGRL